jgi:hypothetical protein
MPRAHLASVIGRRYWPWAQLSFYALGKRISLTPCFSGVFSEGKARQPLKRF